MKKGLFRAKSRKGFTLIELPVVRKSGFTLIELLVVVFIIGLLAALVIVNVSNSRKQARDTKRVANIKAIQTALEMYNEKNGVYPNVDLNWHSDDESNFVPNTVSDGFIPSLPTDPKPKIATEGYTYKSDGTNFKLKAQLESETDTCGSQVTSIKEIADNCPHASPWSWVSVYSSGGKSF